MDSSSSSGSDAIGYFDLMERVGSKGLYQWATFILFVVVWIYSGFTSVNPSFLFLNPGFDCSKLKVEEAKCEEFVCRHFAAALELRNELPSSNVALPHQYF